MKVRAMAKRPLCLYKKYLDYRFSTNQRSTPVTLLFLNVFVTLKVYMEVFHLNKI